MPKSSLSRAWFVTMKRFPAKDASIMTTPEQLNNFSRRIPDGDNVERDVCDTCGFIGYQNPKIVVGAVVTAANGKLLLCKRSIEPRAGYWTLPAGYLELQEAPDEGAMREAMEEANAHIKIDRVLAIYTIARLSQIQIIYRAVLSDPHISPGPESLEVGLFTWEEIPWDDIAFPSVHWALAHYKETKDKARFAPFSNPANPEF